jgi:Lon protease-like protein
MRWPGEIGVMVLPSVILFPQAFLPLYIFEPRYRRMLGDALETHRLYCVAMQQPGRRRGVPVQVAGVGLIRACRQNPDGTSHLILQGLARVELGPATRYRPYRVHPIKRLDSQLTDTAAADALATRLLELVAEQLQQGKPANPGLAAIATMDPGVLKGLQGGVEFLARVTGPEQISDLVSWALQTSPVERQQLLETLDVEARLRRLIQLILAGERETPQGPHPE